MLQLMAMQPDLGPAFNPFTAFAQFDGSTSRLYTDVSSTANSDFSCGVMLVRMGNDNDGQKIWQVGNTSGNGVTHIEKWDVSGPVLATWSRQGTGSSKVDAPYSSLHPTVADGWQVIFWSFDLGGDVFHYVIDNTIDPSVTLYKNNGNYVGWNGKRTNIGSDTGGGAKFTGDLAMLFLSSEWIDFSLEANRRHFIDVNDNPVFPDGDGSVVTGNAPHLYMYGDDFSTGNDRSGNTVPGDWTITGITIGSE